jgi:hypothetical protein
MSMDEPEPIRIERVAGSVTSPMLRGHDAEPADVEEVAAVADQPEFELPWSGVGVGLRSWLLPAAVVLGIGATFASGDPRVGLVAAAVLVLARLVVSADRRVAFSFGEGFVGYRSQMGWPQGVQEDDDFRWAWRPAHRISGR